MERSTLIWRGASRYDESANIRAVLVWNSKNIKTGNMVQLFILPDKTAPHKAVKSGKDHAICGTCPQRPALGGGCYVAVFQGPLSTWKASRKKRLVPLEETLSRLALRASKQERGPVLRLGAYGDVAALPVELVRALVDAVKGRVTGYTHGWTALGLAGVEHLRDSCMLSVESEEMARTAQAAGWRTFRGRPAESADMPGEITCPTEYREETQCISCGLCKGASLPARNISIPVHGFAEKRALRVVSLVSNGRKVA